MLQKTLKYYLESNMYYLEKVEMLLTYFNESDDVLENKIERLAWNKLEEQGGRYFLVLTNAEVKKYLSYNDDKSAMVIFSVWLGLSDKYIKELTSYKKLDVYNKTIEILKKWVQDID